MLKKISNLACPKCKKIITGADLKHWRCVKCGAKFKISFEEYGSKQKSNKNNTGLLRFSKPNWSNKVYKKNDKKTKTSPSNR